MYRGLIALFWGAEFPPVFNPETVATVAGSLKGCDNAEIGCMSDCGLSVKPCAINAPLFALGSVRCVVTLETSELNEANTSLKNPLCDCKTGVKTSVGFWLTL